MADITKCPGNNCNIKQQCYRYNATDGYLQSYFNFNNDNKIDKSEECSDFWLRSKEVENERVGKKRVHSK